MADFDGGGCALGTFGSTCTKPPLTSIGHWLGATLLDRGPTVTPDSAALFNLIKQGSQTRYGLFGLGANEAFELFFELQA
jgi:hypothetical protein